MKILSSTIFILFIIIFPCILLSACHEEPQAINISSKSRVWLGVQLEDLSEKMLKNLNLDSGVKILKVFKDSPADKAGLDEDDIIITFNGESIKNTENLVEMVRNRQIGDEVEITYLRVGEKYSTKVTIGETNKYASGYIIKRKIPNDHFLFHRGHTWLGVNTENLTDQLRDYFTVPEGIGILITNVIAESPAQKAGLLAGDVIIKVANKKIKNTHDLLRAINYFDPEDVVEIIVIRDKKELNFKIKLARKNKSDKFYGYGISPGEIQIEIPDIDIEIPDVEIDIDADELKFWQKELEKDIKIKSQELENKLKSLNEKLKQVQIKMRNWQSAII